MNSKTAIKLRAHRWMFYYLVLKKSIENPYTIVHVNEWFLHSFLYKWKIFHSILNIFQNNDTKNTWIHVSLGLPVWISFLIQKFRIHTANFERRIFTLHNQEMSVIKIKKIFDLKLLPWIRVSENKGVANLEMIAKAGILWFGWLIGNYLRPFFLTE